MLSIAIPTYNRFPFLKWCLAKAHEDFPEATLIVSDNASTDDTRTVQILPQVKYELQPQNIGAFANFRLALLSATTRYVTYLGDDDYLLKPEVAQGIEFLESHPEVICYYAPCQLYDEVHQQVNWNAFYVAHDQTLTNPQTLWNFVIHNHVWPEHAIWRREGLEAIIQPRCKAYWAFLDLALAFHAGPVHFASQPFYRNITHHPVGFRAKLGDQQCLTDFDDYRGGLEILAYELFQGHLTPDLKSKLNLMINHFIAMRLGVAQKLYMMREQPAEAEMLRKRLAVSAPVFA